MLDPAIENFLSERKAARIETKSKSCESEEERRQVEIDAVDEFSLENWLPKAAKRAGQLLIASHPSKFTHSSAKTSPVIAQSKPKADGFLRTGNSKAEYDASGNAAAMDVYKFLNILLADEKTVLEHLEQNTPLIQTQFTLSSETYKNIRTGLLVMKQTHPKVVSTSEKVKQVYFPVGDNYHLLSLLTPSGLIFSLKEKINQLRFSDEAKQAREDRKADKENKHGFSELYHLTVMGYGGTKPQTVSVMNSKNGGTAYLLPSQPPSLDLTYLRRPKANFFEECLYKVDYLDDFKAFQKPLKERGNTYEQSDARDEAIVAVVDSVMEKVWHYRQLEPNWTKDSSLPNAQKMWLDNFYETARGEEDEWLAEIVKAFTTWFRVAYEKMLGKKAIRLDDIDLNHIFDEIEACSEELR
jgi:CRISPR-associated protein Csy1